MQIQKVIRVCTIHIQMLKKIHDKRDGDKLNFNFPISSKEARIVVSAMKLELIEDAEHLDYTSEYNLNTKPLEMDLLIVKKSKDVEIKNQIGKIFRRHNIIEYKSPEDSMNLNTYMKVIAYACLYKAYENLVDEIELAVLQVAVQENDAIFSKIREEGKMCEALMKLMEPEIKEVVDKALKNAEENIIENALRNGNSVEAISTVIGLPMEEVEKIAKEMQSK